MNRSVAVSFALLLGSTVMAAQTGGQGYGFGVVQNVTPGPDGKMTWTTRAMSPAEAEKAAANALANSCPVSLRAQQAGAAYRREVGASDAAPKGVVQHLHLVVTNPDAKKVVAATVTVRGLTDKPRVTQTLTTQDATDAAKTVDVRFGGSGKEVSANLKLPGFSAVSSVELNSVTYGDGSTWKLATGSVCRTPVDGFMLVGSR